MSDGTLQRGWCRCRRLCQLRHWLLRQRHEANDAVVQWAVPGRAVQCGGREYVCSVQRWTVRQRERQSDSGLQWPVCSGICMRCRINDANCCRVSTRPVLHWWRVVVQCMCRWVLLSNARLAVTNQHHMSIRLCVSGWQLERHFDGVWEWVLLSIGHSQRDCRQVLREWCDVDGVVAAQRERRQCIDVVD